MFAYKSMQSCQRHKHDSSASGGFCGNEREIFNKVKEEGKNGLKEKEKKEGEGLSLLLC